MSIATEPEAPSLAGAVEAYRAAVVCLAQDVVAGRVAIREVIEPTRECQAAEKLPSDFRMDLQNLVARLRAAKGRGGRSTGKRPRRSSCHRVMSCCAGRSPSSRRAASLPNTC